MIRELKTINDIVALWQDAFGDSEAEICFFAENVKDADCRAYYMDNKPVAMLYLINCQYKGVTGGYVYAACTDRAYRQQGIMAKLLAYCKEIMPFVCLIPANAHLVAYYQKQGFTKLLNTEAVTFSQSAAITEYLFDGCELEKPILLMTEE